MQPSTRKKSELPLVRLNLIVPMIRELETRRIESTPVLSEFDLSLKNATHSDMFVPAAMMYAIVEKLASASGDPHFGLRVGAQLDPFSWSPLSEAARISRTVGEFLLRFLIDASRDQSSVTYTLTSSGKRSTFHERRFTDGGILPRHNDGFTIAYLLTILRQAMGEPWEGHKVLVRLCDPEVIPKGYLDVRVATTDTLGPSITFPSRWLVLPVGLTKIDRNSQDQIAIKLPAREAINAFRQVLEPHIHEFNLSLGRVAELCGINKRTLARRLRDKNTSVYRELSQMRRQRAEQELISTDRTVADIAASVGYADPAVFSRAFKRWSGSSPSEYRKKHRKTRME